MSALGQKQTFRLASRMSALPPKATNTEVDPARAVSALTSICLSVTKLVCSASDLQGQRSPVPGIACGVGLDFGAVANFNFLKDRTLDNLHRVAPLHDMTW